MRARRARNERPLADRDVTRQHGVVRHDDLVREMAVVRDVRVRHNHAVVADGRRGIGVH